MGEATYLVGDVFDRMSEMEDGSVDLIVTSPPFLALRSYLPADHPDKSKEIGSEPTPAAFIDTMLALSAEWRRLLAPHGSIAVELGETYSGSGGAGGDYNEDGLREGQPRYKASDARKNARVTLADGRTIQSAGIGNGQERKGPGWPLAKSKTLIPELYRIALAYGIHPLTGQPSPAGTWRIRNVVTWCRPNPPVGALGDKWRPATSDIVVACVSGRRYWDDIATRREHKYPDAVRPNNRKQPERFGERETNDTIIQNASGAPLLDYWELPPGGYPGSHYAVYPPALIEPLVKAMAPPRVCVECGEPSRRIVETNYDGATWPSGGQKNGLARQPERQDLPFSGHTTGWSDCGHNAWRPALILDPFAGSGTTLMVATGHGHNAIGIDIDERNADLARERIGELFLTVDPAHA